MTIEVCEHHDVYEGILKDICVDCGKVLSERDSRQYSVLMGCNDWNGDLTVLVQLKCNKCGKISGFYNTQTEAMSKFQDHICK